MTGAGITPSLSVAAAGIGFDLPVPGRVLFDWPNHPRGTRGESKQITISKTEAWLL